MVIRENSHRPGAGASVVHPRAVVRIGGGEAATWELGETHEDPQGGGRGTDPFGWVWIG